MRARTNTRLPLFFAIVALCVLGACQKDATGPNVVFDSAFVGVWYSDSDQVGFEVNSDGTSKTLIVDTAGTLQYATATSGAPGAISLTLVSGLDGNLIAKVRYDVPGFVDTTFQIPGTYAFSNSNNTLTINFPNPSSPGQVLTMVFRRSSIGAVVRVNSSASRAFLRRRQ